jgi:hypothetical protein
MYVCPNPECENTEDFERNVLVYGRDLLKADGEVWSTKYDATDVTGPVVCEWCETEAEQTEE